MPVNPNAKLTHADAHAARIARGLGVPVRATADRLGVSDKTVYRVLGGESWRAAEPPEA